MRITFPTTAVCVCALGLHAALSRMIKESVLLCMKVLDPITSSEVFLAASAAFRLLFIYFLLTSFISNPQKDYK